MLPPTFYKVVFATCLVTMVITVSYLYFIQNPLEEAQYGHEQWGLEHTRSQEEEPLLSQTFSPLESGNKVTQGNEVDSKEADWILMDGLTISRSCVNSRTLLGSLHVNLDPTPLSIMVKMYHNELQLGGYFVPNCSHSQNVAIIVPYRNRQEHLRIFLDNLHPILQRQQLEYQIFVIEQQGEDPFNRASLLNIGFVEALKIRNFSCFIFHDVDLIPENDLNLYDCPHPDTVRHLSVAVDTLNYTLPYPTIIGGVTAFTQAQFMRVNGYSNRYWGWGGEDDDLYERVTLHDLSVERPNETVGRYTMTKHNSQVGTGTLRRFKMVLAGRPYYAKDGLTDISKTVEVTEVTLTRLYTLMKAQFLPKYYPGFDQPSNLS